MKGAPPLSVSSESRSGDVRGAAALGVCGCSYAGLQRRSVEGRTTAI